MKTKRYLSASAGVATIAAAALVLSGCAAGSRNTATAQTDSGGKITVWVDPPRVPAAEVINVKTTCTNRDLPAKLPFGGREGDFEVEGTALLSRVHCLTKPTETVRPPQRRSLHTRKTQRAQVEAQVGPPVVFGRMLTASEPARRSCGKSEGRAAL